MNRIKIYCRYHAANVDAFRLPAPLCCDRFVLSRRQPARVLGKTGGKFIILRLFRTSGASALLLLTNRFGKSERPTSAVV